jgi:ferredoxin--NADP+ reductase
VDEVFDRLQRGAHMYCCGLKGMMAGVMGVLEAVCQVRGLVWADTLREWKAAGRWHVEVY